MVTLSTGMAVPFNPFLRKRTRCRSSQRPRSVGRRIMALGWGDLRSLLLGCRSCDSQASARRGSSAAGIRGLPPRGRVGRLSVQRALQGGWAIQSSFWQRHARSMGIRDRNDGALPSQRAMGEDARTLVGLPPPHRRPPVGCPRVTRPAGGIVRTGFESASGGLNNSLLLHRRDACATRN